MLRANVNPHPLLRNNINSMGVGHSFPIPFVYSNIYGTRGKWGTAARFCIENISNFKAGFLSSGYRKTAETDIAKFY